jgi:predicted transcriptional regulator
MDAALGTLQDGEAGPVLVAQAGQVVGIITPSDLTHRPPRQQALDISAP